MKRSIYICLFLGGCASFPSENEFYHRFAVKPSIVEHDLGNGQRQEDVVNPYEVPIVASVDCDNEMGKRTITIKSNSTSTFKTVSNTDHNCSIVQWQTN